MESFDQQTVQLHPTGELIFTGGPQTFIFCGICDSHFMRCECDLKNGKNYIWKGLPNPPPNATISQNLQRWASLVRSSGSDMKMFDAQSWLDNEGPDVLAAFAVKSQDLLQMMEDYIKLMPNDIVRLSAMAKAAGGDPLEKSNNVEEQVNVIGQEGRVAVQTFLQGDWSCVTLLGIFLIQNAFQSSDPNVYRLSDPNLGIIFQKAVACLCKVLEMGMNDYGWRLAMECDRKPQIYKPKFTSEVGSRCGNCQQLGAKMTCSRCKQVQYCNKECQKQHWKCARIGHSHKKACQSQVRTATERDYLLQWCAKNSY
mmetsp:Transcript_14285/g.22312  ORF Transcript_14285/g.22312 Transcript_14285/m.22312 type:complete len:312 (-) Transcript_14285:614-1549(-)